MSQSIGANIYGFIIGGSIFLVQLTLFGAHQFFNRKPQMDILTIFPWIFGGLVGVVFVLALLFWASSVILVYPASFLFRIFQINARSGAAIGGFIAGLICWVILESPGVEGNTPWQFYYSCLTSSIITGAATGYMLGQITNKKQNKSEMATPRRPSD